MEEIRRKQVLSHIVLPAILPFLFCVVVLTPVHVLGCANRGLAALTVSLVSAFGALGAAVRGARGRFRGDPDALWWVISTLILTIPVIGVLILA